MRLEEQNSEHFGLSKCTIFMQPPHINFPRYHKKFFRVGSGSMSIIQISFQNVEVYHIFAVAIS